MPFTDTQPALPWQGRSSHTKFCSHAAAVSASRTRALKSAQYLDWLRQVEQATDAGAAEHFGWGVSSINSIRNGLVKQGKVTSMGVCMGRQGVRVTIWTATA